jgi:hypothetical protein
MQRRLDNDRKMQDTVWNAARLLDVGDRSDEYYCLADLATKFPKAAFNGATAELEDYKQDLLDQDSRKKPLENSFGFFVYCVTNGNGKPAPVGASE